MADGASVVKRDRKHPTADYPVMMPRPRPPHHGKPRGWLLALALLAVALIVWLALWLLSG